MITNTRQGVARTAKDANLALIRSMASEGLITHEDEAAWKITVGRAFSAAKTRASSLATQKQIRETLQDIQRRAWKEVASRALSKLNPRGRHHHPDEIGAMEEGVDNGGTKCGPNGGRSCAS
jgi:hypothetical protein